MRAGARGTRAALPPLESVGQPGRAQASTVGVQAGGRSFFGQRTTRF